MEEQLIEILKGIKSKKSISFDDIVTKMGVSKENVSDLKDILNDKVDNYEVYVTPKGDYKLMSKTSFRKGIFHAYKNGGGKVLVVSSYEKDGEQVVNQKEYSIASNDAYGAVNNDEVLIEVNLKDQNDINAKVIDVIDRKLESIYGRVKCNGSIYFVEPVDKKLKNIKVFVEKNAIEGQLVEVKLDKMTSNDTYIGSIIRKFEYKDDPKEDILMEAFFHGIDDKFSDESIEQIKNTPMEVLDEDYIGREDLRNITTFTIDGKDTNDIDDALSIKMLENGNFELIVSIADVSRYVPYNSPLDLDARRKGTSCYLAGMVIPMLPHELSNGICSLNQDVERCAMSCRMEIDNNGNVIRYDIFPSIIKSNLKMNYDAVNNILYNKYNNIDFPCDYKDYEEDLKNLYKLSLILRKKRIKNGAIEFNRPEIKVVLDNDGIPSKIVKRIQDLGENLIEECMIAANVTVFSHMDKYDIPADYRIHDKPNKERLCEFFKILNVLEIPFDKYSVDECCEDPYAMQELVDFINQEGLEELSVMLNTNLIKCMSRAKYSVNNIGHSGLAEDNYGHFTSPIRRYPDLTIHRIIKDCVLNKKEYNHNKNKWKVRLPEICYQSSKMEKVADECERDVIYMKTAEYMLKHIGEEFDGIIIGINENGINIQLDNLIEGKIKIKDLKGRYKFNEETLSLVSLDDEDDYFIGDVLKVCVNGSSKENKSVYFKVNNKIKDRNTKKTKDSNQKVKRLAKFDINKKVFS